MGTLFRSLWDAGDREVIPGIPPMGKLSKTSGISEIQLGKIPGIYGRGVWTGYPEWTTIEITEADIKKFDTWPTENVCQRSSEWPGMDVDVTHAPFPPLLEAFMRERYGHIAVRTRGNSPRLLIPFHRKAGSPPWGKVRVGFTVPGLVDEIGQVIVQWVEFLAAGQQYLINGIHPSGARYEWKDGVDMAKAIMLDAVPELDKDEWFALINDVGNFIQAQGYTIVSVKHSGDHEGDGAEIGDASLRALDIAKLTEALACIKCGEIADYNEWVSYMHAIKGACGGDEAFYADHVWPWAQEYAKNTEDDVRRVWDSITRSTIGADWLYARARNEWKWEGTPEEFDDEISQHARDEKAQSQTQSEPKKGGHMPFPHVIDGNFDGRKLPLRVWTLGVRFAPGTVTLGVAEPAAGKTTVSMCSAVAIATGRELTGETVFRQGAVWVICNEESVDELNRKLAAVLAHYQIPVSEVASKIIISSGEEKNLTVAFKNQAGLINLTVAVEEMVNYIHEQNIVHVVIDPLVSVHEGIEENDNAALEKVMTALRRIAHEGDCSVDLLHHSNKSGGNQSGIQAVARGASSIVGAARHMYTLTRVDDAEIKKLGLDPAPNRDRLVKLSAAKSNYSTREDAARYFRFHSVNLLNGPEGEELLGDNVGVVEPVKIATAHSDTAQSPDADASSLLVMIVEAMKSDRSPVKDIVPALMKRWGVSETAVRQRIKAHLPLDEWRPVQVDDTLWELRMKRNGAYNSAPLILHRRRAGANREDAKAA